MHTENSEQEKYQDIWNSRDYTSRSAKPYAEYLRGIVSGSVLEIGSGKGVSLDILNEEEEIQCVGIDIVANKSKKGSPIIQAPAWRLPFKSNSFDFSFSTDVLEHIPLEFIERTLIEIWRVTRSKTLHQIATFKMGDEHLIVRPIAWWNDKFMMMGIPNFELTERILTI